MNCTELEITLADYLEGELAEAQVDELLAHTDSCAACAAALEAYRRQDEQLKRFYGQRLAHASEQVDFNELPAESSIQVLRRGPSRAWMLIAAAVLIALLGAGGLFSYRYYAPMGHGPVATVKTINGQALVRVDGIYRELAVGEVVRQADRIKVARGGYLCLELPNGNLIEAKGGTQLALLDLAGRTELDMNRGHIWAHLKKPLVKRFAVRTRHSLSIATGTVYGVEEGLDRSVIEVAEGTVLVESGGVDMEISEGESYSTRDDAEVADAGLSTEWSRYPENLTSLSAEDAYPDNGYELQVASSDIAQPEAVIADVSDAPRIDDLIDVLPSNTLFMVDMRDWPEILDGFRDSAYADLAEEAGFATWWETYAVGETLGAAADDLDLLSLLNLATLVDGQLAMSITDEGKFVLVADCAGHEQEVIDLVAQLAGPEDAQALLDSLGPDEDPFEALLRYNEEQTFGDLNDQLRDHIDITRGRLVISSDADLLRSTVNHIAMGEPTEFADSVFRRQMADNANGAQFMAAVDAESIVDKILEEGDENQRKLFDFLGVTALDYLLLSPNFVGQGMNQAARLGFSPERYGAMDWLSEPAPMRGLDFLSPETHLFGSVIIRSPRRMVTDFMVYLASIGETAERDRIGALLEKHSILFDALGGEITMGLDSPVLPIPNVKLMVEVNYAEGLTELIEAFLADAVFEIDQQTDVNIYMEEAEYRGRTIYTVVAQGAPVEPSYAFVDDYLVMGPGSEFVRHSIDVYDSGRSIATDADFVSLLPTDSRVDFSMLGYQDIARSIPSFLEDQTGTVLEGADLGFVQDLAFLEGYRAPSIAFAYADPQNIDFYMNSSGGIDFNVAMAAPLVAAWLEPRVDVVAVMEQYNATLLDLTVLELATDDFVSATGGLPGSLAELIEATGGLTSVPADPFAQLGDRALRMAIDPDTGALIFYSVGPDGIDDGGLIEYNPEMGIDSEGDILIQIQPPAA